MSDEWTPRRGDKVKLVVQHVLGPNRFARIQLVEVTRVTESGFAYIKAENGVGVVRELAHKFHTAKHPTRCGVFVRRDMRQHAQFHYYLEKLLPHEAQIVPRGERQSREYASEITKLTKAGMKSQ